MSTTTKTRDRLMAHCDAPGVYDPPAMADVMLLVRALEAENTRLRKALEAVCSENATFFTAENSLKRLREIARAALQEDEG